MDLPPELITPLFANARLLARAVEEGLQAERDFLAINNRVSQSVPHLHIHIVPRRRKDGLRGFFWPRQKYPDESAIRETQEAIRTALQLIQDSERQPLCAPIASRALSSLTWAVALGLAPLKKFVGKSRSPRYL